MEDLGTNLNGSVEGGPEDRRRPAGDGEIPRKFPMHAGTETRMPRTRWRTLSARGKLHARIHNLANVQIWQIHIANCWRLFCCIFCQIFRMASHLANCCRCSNYRICNPVDNTVISGDIAEWLSEFFSTRFAILCISSIGRPGVCQTEFEE